MTSSDSDSPPPVTSTRGKKRRSSQVSTSRKRAPLSAVTIPVLNSALKTLTSKKRTGLRRAPPLISNATNLPGSSSSNYDPPPNPPIVFNQPSTSAAAHTVDATNKPRGLIASVEPQPFNAGGTPKYKVKYSRAALLKRHKPLSKYPEFKGGEKDDLNRLPSRHGMYACTLNNTETLRQQIA